ncbi:hypothetical protein GCM10022393_19090 [Aquimarina addita]|uniref:Uncharacterized protein n=1 Tax=Aquimarina addita TaxID=870485 RepID=A0ABP6UHT1_9FLAO
MKNLLVITGILISFICSWSLSKAYYQSKSEEESAIVIQELTEKYQKMKVIDSLKIVASIEKPQIGITCIKNEDGSLNKSEKEFLDKVKKYYSDIEVPISVSRKFIYENDEYHLEQVAFNYSEDDNGLYFGTYPYYNVEIKKDTQTYELVYSNSAGRALTSFGTITYNSMTEEVIRVDYNFGTGAGTSAIYVNGIQQYEKSEQFDTIY